MGGGEGGGGFGGGGDGEGGGGDGGGEGWGEGCGGCMCFVGAFFGAALAVDTILLWRAARVARRRLSAAARSCSNAAVRCSGLSSDSGSVRECFMLRCTKSRSARLRRAPSSGCITVTTVATASTAASPPATTVRVGKGMLLSDSQVDG